MRHNRWLSLAAKMARHSEASFGVGAAVVRSGNVLSTGFNKVRNSVEVCNALEEAHTHAEMDAINGCDNLKGATVYVARELADGSYGTSMPCWRCAYSLQESGVKRVVYVNEDGEVEILDFKGRVPDFSEAYRKANKKFNSSDSFVFRSVSYEWINLISV